MRNAIYSSRAAVRRQFLATTMLTALGAGVALLGPRALAQTADQPAPESEITGIETANLQSIEILKGPAAFLFGRLEPGGIVNLIVKRPLDTPYYSVQEQTGSWGLTRTTVDATGPLTDDKTWLYRVILDYTHNNNAFTDFVTNQNALVQRSPIIQSSNSGLTSIPSIKTQFSWTMPMAFRRLAPGPRPFRSPVTFPNLR
jgi:outer membrane receptor protein involved in Fe transport